MMKGAHNGPVGFQAKGLVEAILAGLFACVASWAGMIFLLVLTIRSPGDHLAEGLLLAWVALVMACYVAQEIGGSSGIGQVWWLGILLVPGLPLILPAIWLMHRTAPLRQRRRQRRWQRQRARLAR